MILAHHPYLPPDEVQQLLERHRARGTDPSDLVREASLKGIGYWGPESGWPDPRDHVDLSWDPQERGLVAAYVRGAPRNRHWRFLGFSSCRFACGITPEDLGTGERSDDAYIWPVGFVHYIEAHSVRPPTELVEHVLRRTGGRPA